jgi:hypothetical protein
MLQSSPVSLFLLTKHKESQELKATTINGEEIILAVLILLSMRKR